MPNQLFGPLHPRSLGQGSATRPPLREPFFGNVIDPFQVYRRTKAIMAEETRRARDEAPGTGNLTDDIYDAERHARSSHRMEKEVGPAYATLGGAYHELENLGAAALRALLDGRARQALLDGSVLRSGAMDMHNNAVGRSAAASGQAIPNRQTPNLRPRP